MKGYLTIITVLVLLAVTGGIASALSFASIDAIQSQEALRQGEQALLFSEACLEDGLLQIVRDPNYNGGTFTMPDGDCEVVVGKNEAVYTVSANGKNAKFERSVVVTATLDLVGMQVTNWKEE